MLFNTNCLSEVSDFGISLLTIWQLNHLLSHFALQPSSGSHSYSGTSIQAQITGVGSGVAAGGRECYLQCNCFNYILFLTFWPSNSYPSDFFSPLV